jgi:hypothetical protein
VAGGQGAEDVYRKFIAADKTEKGIRPVGALCPRPSKPTGPCCCSTAPGWGTSDVLVAERGFQRAPRLVRGGGGCFGGLCHPAKARRSRHGDAGATGSEKLTSPMAEKLVSGIDWKNTLENYALRVAAKDINGQLRLKTSSPTSQAFWSKPALAADPLEGRPQASSTTKRPVQAAQFHPGRKLAVVEDWGPAPAARNCKTGSELRLSPIRSACAIPGRPAGTLLAFARGGTPISRRARFERTRAPLNAWPPITSSAGHARAEGDAEANSASRGAGAGAAAFLSLGSARTACGRRRCGTGRRGPVGIVRAVPYALLKEVSPSASCLSAYRVQVKEMAQSTDPIRMHAKLWTARVQTFLGCSRARSRCCRF